MRPQYIFSIGVVALSLAAGCSRKEAVVAKPATAAQPAVATTSPGAEQQIHTKSKTSTAPKKSESEAAKATLVSSAKQTKAVVNKPERIAILAPGGPIVVDLLLTIDGRPHIGKFDDMIDQVLKAADSDNDGTSTWRELANNKEYLAQRGGNIAADVSYELKTWVERFDRNHDGKIQRDEAASWLGRDTGVTASAFDVRGTRSYASVPSATSRIWKLLDSDHDNRLSRDEIARAAATLLSLDENDDGMITPDELVPLREQLRIDGDRASALNNAANAYAAIYLEPQYEVDRLEYLLTDLYASQQLLRPTSFPSLSRVYKQLDIDDDDQLTQDELGAMRTMPPQLKLFVEFGTDTAKGQAKVRVVEHVPEIEVALQPAPDRLLLKLGATQIVLMAQDRMRGQSPPNATGASEIRMLVHDQCDALGELLDSDADGRLGEREIASSAERLLKFDANKDGQISTDELPYYMVAAIVRGEGPGEMSLYRPVSRLPAATAGAPSWFLDADYNADGVVSRREFLGTVDQFSKLDRNGDGFISVDEATSATAAHKKSNQ